jgi:hypothetical protein
MWLDDWQALAARMLGLAESGDAMARALAVNTDDAGSIRQFLVPAGQEALTQLRAFGDTNREALGTAAMAIDRFLSAPGFHDRTDFQIRNVQRLMALRALVTEVNYCLSDRDARGRSAVEWAFLHLQRSLAADPDLQAKWLKAVGNDEPACEKLGAVHLLSHGIFPFKASAAGAATDLILGERIDPEARDLRNARTLVLTEWKLVTSVDVENKAEQARRQLKKYSTGILAGLMLRSRRYAVLVSENEVPVPADLVEGDVTYQHVRVIVRPPTPSKSKH